MKKPMLLLPIVASFVIGLTSPGIFAGQGFTTDRSYKGISEEQSVTMIRGSIDHTEPLTVTIDKPGLYKLANNIVGTALPSAVEITASNVTLDLGDFTVTGGTNAIIVSGSKVTVKNGTVCNATEAGVLLSGDQCRILNVEAVGNATGFSLVSADDNMVKNCRALSNISVGFSLCHSQNNCIEDCKAVDNGNGGDAYGFISTAGCQNSFVRCVAKDTHTSAITTSTCLDGHIVAGLALDGFEQKSEIVDCTAMCTEALVTGSAASFGIYAPCELTAKIIGSGPDDFPVESEWLTVGSRNFLLIGTQGPAGDVRVLELDETNCTLDLAGTASFNLSGGNSPSAKWLEDDSTGRKYVGAAFFTGDIRVLEFDVSGLTLEQVGTATFEHGDTISRVDWLRCDGKNYLAAGGLPSPIDGAEVRVLEFDATASTLDQVGTATYVYGGATFLANTVAWFVDDSSGKKYLATAGFNFSSSALEIVVLEFDPIFGTLTEIDRQTFDDFATFASVDPALQLVQDDETGRVYLAIKYKKSSAPDVGRVAVLEFDFLTSSLIILDDIAVSVAPMILGPWYTSSCGEKILATGLPAFASMPLSSSSRFYVFDESTSKLSFLKSFAQTEFSGTIPAGISWLNFGGSLYYTDFGVGSGIRSFSLVHIASGCAIKDNCVRNTTGTTGVGIYADSSEHYVAGNVSCDNDTNYSLVDSIYLASQENARGVDNVDCSLTEADKVCVIDSKVDEIQTTLGNLDCNVDFTPVESQIDKCCYTVNSKLDVLLEAGGGGSCDLTPVESQLDVIESKIDLPILSVIITFTGLDEVNSKLDVIDGNLDDCCYTINSRLDFLNVDCDLTSVESQLDVIESKLDLPLVSVIVTFTGFEEVDSKLDVIDANLDDCCFTVNSKLDVIDDDLGDHDFTVNSKLDELLLGAGGGSCDLTDVESQLDVIESKVSSLAFSVKVTVTGFDAVSSQLDLVQLELTDCCYTVNSRLDKMETDLNFKLDSALDILTSV